MNPLLCRRIRGGFGDPVQGSGRDGRLDRTPIESQPSELRGPKSRERRHDDCSRSN